MHQVIQDRHMIGIRTSTPSLVTRTAKSHFTTSESSLMLIRQQVASYTETTLNQTQQQEQMEKFAHVANGLFSGQFIQLGSISFVWAGFEFDFNSVVLFIGILFSLLGLVISFRSYQIQKVTNLKQLELAEMELQKVKLESELIIKENPELKNGNVSKNKRRVS